MHLGTLNIGHVASSYHIAEATKIPRTFLTKILGQLAKKGLVVSVTGKGGGFRLARTANSITLYEILDIARQTSASTNGVVVHVENMLDGILKKWTLKRIMESAQNGSA